MVFVPSWVIVSGPSCIFSMLMFKVLTLLIGCSKFNIISFRAVRNEMFVWESSSTWFCTCGVHVISQHLIFELWIHPHSRFMLSLRFNEHILCPWLTHVYRMHDTNNWRTLQLIIFMVRAGFNCLKILDRRSNMKLYILKIKIEWIVTKSWKHYTRGHTKKNSTQG